MTSELKVQIRDILKSLGYPAPDNNTYNNTYPLITLRFNNSSCEVKNGVLLRKVLYTIDIFSTYNGDKEILDINDKINDVIFSLPQQNHHITAMKQQCCLIMDDEETGPIRKHGVLTYEFRLTSAVDEEEEEKE